MGMPTVEKSIEVNAPLDTVYNQWTQFEDFPRFMEGVEEVTQLDDQRLHWVANVAGQRKEWHARITEQVPTTASHGPARAAPSPPASSPSSASRPRPRGSCCGWST